jgi:hypothetical protein
MGEAILEISAELSVFYLLTVSQTILRRGVRPRGLAFGPVEIRFLRTASEEFDVPPADHGALQHEPQVCLAPQHLWTGAVIILVLIIARILR